jgi:hypothetical protein
MPDMSTSLFVFYDNYVCHASYDILHGPNQSFHEFLLNFKD